MKSAVFNCRSMVQIQTVMREEFGIAAEVETRLWIKYCLNPFTLLNSSLCRYTSNTYEQVSNWGMEDSVEVGTLRYTAVN